MIRMQKPLRVGQHGQAMAEFVVLAVFVLSVLLLAIVSLAKLNDVRNKVLMGSRYAAWERTLWIDGNFNKPESGPPAWEDPATDQGWYSQYGPNALAARKDDIELKAEFLRRVVTANGEPLRQTDREVSYSLPKNLQAMWLDHSGKALVGRSDEVRVVSDVRDPGAEALRAQTAGPFGSVNDSRGRAVVARMNLSTRNLQRAAVSVDAGARNPALVRLWPTFKGLTFTDTTVMLSNTWMPEGTDSHQALFAQAVPASRANLVEPGQYRQLAIYAPEIADLQFGRLAPDVVPYERVSQ